MTKEVKTGKGSFLFVEVPDGVIDVSISTGSSGGDGSTGYFICFKRQNWSKEYKQLPGQYTYLCLSKGIHNAEIMQIVDWKFDDYDDIYFKIYYGNLDDDQDEWSGNQEESFSSLLKANQLDENKVYAILLNSLNK